MPGDERMAFGTAPGLDQRLRIERTLAPGDHGQDGPGRPLSPDVEDAAHLLHAVEAAEPVGQGFERRERLAVEDRSAAGGGTHDAVAVGRSEDGRDLVDQLKLVAVVADQRPQVVIDTEPRDAEDRRRRDRRRRQPAGGLPRVAKGRQTPVAGGSGRRCRSAGSTIQPRQCGAPQRHGMAASAGQL